MFRTSRIKSLLALLLMGGVLMAGANRVVAQRPLGIDVSSVQGSINWTSVKTSGVSYAWCKATEGFTFNDSFFTVNMANAKTAGVLIGAYHYARPDNQLGVAGAQQEADHFWGIVSNYIKGGSAYMVPVLDIEVDLTGAGYTKATLSQWVNAWCASVTNHAASNGIILKPLVYTYVSYASTWLDNTVTNWPLWMAQYPVSPDPQNDSPSGTSPWASSNWKFWQYSSTGSVPGISGDCDQDVFNGTASGLYPFVIGGLPPVFVSPLSDRYADVGQSLTFSAPVTNATPPFKYQWRFNGTNILNATNTTLVLGNIQPTNAGNYTVIVTNIGGRATSDVATLTVNALYAPVFADDFDTDSSANWTLNRATSDNRAIFCYEYASNGIPIAPHTLSGSTKGLRLEANISAGLTNALSVSPIGQAFPTNSRLHFDMWINANGPFPGGGGGSTESVTAGVGTVGNHVQWNLASANADGVWFSINGEGGASETNSGTSDFLAYKGGTLQGIATGYYAAGTGSTARGNFDPYYANVFPGGQMAPALQQSAYPLQQTGSLNIGTVGFAWRDVVVSRNGSTVEWFIDGLRIATVTGASLTASNIFVGFWDPFNSLTDNTNLSFGLIDNLRVEVPAVAPSIASHPQNTWAQIGSNATFTVTASGIPAPAYQWKLNGTNISGATNASLLLATVQGTNAGLYSVLVTNIAGAQTSSNALLSLIGSIQPTMQLAGVPVGGSVQLDCLGEVGASYSLETSTNLVSWTTVTNIVANAAAFSFTPSVSPDDFQRYFRLRSGP